MFSDAQKAALIERSENGEGIVAILQSFGIEENQGLEWLKQNFSAEVKAAKQVQVSRRVAG